jgi:ubiquitin-protein ligase E3 C
MFFDGGSSGRGNVSLGGAGRGRQGAAENRAQFLKRQHKERDERERKRLRESSALKIQSRYRSWRSRKITSTAHRAIFDKRCADIAKVEQILPEEQKALFIFKALLPILRMFVFFFSITEDQGRLAKMLQMISFSGARPAATNFFHLALADLPVRRSFLVLFEGMLVALLKSNKVCEAAQLLQLLWAVLGPADAEKSGAVASHLLLRTQILQALTAEAMFIERGDVSTTDLVFFSCCGIAASPIPKRLELQALLFSGPLLWERLSREPADGKPHTCLQRMTEVFLFTPEFDGFTGLGACLDRCSAQGVPRWALLLGNLSIFVARMLEMPTLDWAKVPVWLEWISWCKRQAPAAARDSSFSTQLQLVHGASLARALLHHVNANDSQQLLPSILRLYFPVPGLGVSEESVVEPPSEVLQVLAFGTPLVERLFPSISVVASSPDFDIASNTDLSLRLRAFCSVYTLQLQSMYDAEFFGPDNPLRAHEIALIVPALNRLAYKFVTAHAAKKRESAASAPLPIGFQSLGRALTGLVRALYHRHLRKPILEESTGASFLIPEARHLLRSAPVVDLGTDEAPQDESMDPDNDDEDGVDSPVAAPARPARLPARLGGDSSARDVLEAVLDDLPHVLPFQDRVALLHNVILLDQGNREHTRAPWHRFEQQLHKIRRNFLVEDGFAAFADLDSEEEIRSIFKVEFIAPDGEPESGIDGGGLFKEFMIHICREVFDPKFGLFAVTDDQTLYPSPSAFRAHPNAAELYRFMGKVVGKAIYEMFLLEAQFSRVFLNRILGHTNEVDDVAALDKDLHKGMLRLKECPRVEDLALTFSISTAHLGHAEDVDLIPNGRNIPVTSANLTQYLHVVANFRTNLQLQRHTSAFMQGIQCCIPLSWLKMFDPYELNTLISGSSRGFDISDLYQHCVYGGGFNQRSQAIQWLWQLLQQMDSDDLGHFLMFTTSCSRPPLLGFKTLYPQFCIHMVPDATRLPTASTCANLLKLPNYGSFETLKLKVMQAIRAECGFDLS